MKQLAVLLLMTLIGSVGSMYHAFWGLLLYYTLAVLRPQHLWKWALPVEWRWSLFAAAFVFLGVFLNLPAILKTGRMNRVAVLIILYGCCLVFSCLTAFDPAVAQSWGVEYAKVLVIAVIGCLVIDSIRQIRAIGLMLLLVIGYIAWEVNSLYFFDGRLDIFHYGFGGLDNNGAALMIAMGLPFAYAYGFHGPKRWHRIAAGVIGVIMIHAVMMTYSRGAMLAGIVGILFVLWHHRQRLQTVMVVALLCVVISALAGNEIRNRFISTTSYEEDKSAQSRFESWSAAWAIACDHPLTGQGIRNSSAYIHNYGADRVGRTVHSQYLQIAADSGFPAAISYTALMLLAMFNLSRSRRVCDDALDAGELSPKPYHNDLMLTRSVILACHGSLVIFAFGGLFLSMEMFEQPWILLVIAGVLPDLLPKHLQQLETAAATPPLEPTHRPVNALPRTLSERLKHTSTGVVTP